MTVSQPMPAPEQATVSKWGGRWYIVVTIVSVGLLAWVPFVHAAGRLGRRSLYVRAGIYGAGAVVVACLLAMTPQDAQGHPVGAAGQAFSLIGTLVVLSLIAVACIQQASLRREVFSTAVQPRYPGVPVGTDPAVAAVLAARSRRAEARALAARDPLIARELRIGRPDLQRTYDDGGLVDLNSAPAAVIARVCDLPAGTAEEMVAARTAGGGLVAVDDVFALVDVPIGAWDRVRDRGVVLPL